MDIELQDWIRWGLGLVLVGYVRYTHMQVDKLRDRLDKVEHAAAAASVNSETLKRLEGELSSLTKVVYKIAGHLGIQTGE